MSSLRVELFGQPTGTLEIAPGGDPMIPEDWVFHYLPSYLADKLAPLSVVLPLRELPYIGAVSYNWFANLLPEGQVRDVITHRLRIRQRDNFALLGEIGGECAGAVSILSDRQRIDPPPSETAVQFEEALLSLGEGAWALLGGRSRLSLAGAQDKIAVVRDFSGLRLPKTGEPSTHIIKPDSSRLPGLCDLEMLGLSLAAALKLPVAKAEIVAIAGTRALLVERYDRVLSGGQVTRLHQEDFCQALGLPPELKYQSQGGPSLSACATLIRDRLSLGPFALQAFLDWVIFVALIGNADAHGKNLALLRAADGRLQLAPFYDLVPTIVWPQRMLDRRPALSIGGASGIDRIEATHWEAFALATGFRPLFVTRRVLSLAGAAIHALPGVLDRGVANGADSKQLMQAGEVLTKQLLRSVKSVK